MNITAFLTKNKVFLLGLLGAIAVCLQGLLTGTPETTDLKVYLFSALIAALSYVSKEWRGQGVTITGILGALAGAFVQLHETGQFSWNQFIIYSILAILSAVAPPAKPESYETDKTLTK